MSMTAQRAGIPAYDSTVAEEPRRPGSVRRYASIGHRVAKATFYTFAIVFVTGIFVGLLMGMTSAHADDGGSGGDGGSSSSGTSSSSGGDGSSSSSGDGGSSSSGDGGSSSSDGGDGGSSDGGVSAASTDGGDSSSSTDGGDSAESSAAPGDSSSANGDTASSSDEGSPSAQGEDSSATGTQSVATSPDATSDDSSAVASSDTPSTTVNGEATTVDGISVSNVSIDAPDPSSATLGNPTAAEAASAQQGETTTTAPATETAAQPNAEQATDPSADAAAAAAVPGTVVDNAPSFLSSEDRAAMDAAAQVGSEQDPAGTPTQPNTDDALSTPVPGTMVDNAVSFLSPEDLATIRDAAQIGAIDPNAPPVANPDAVIAEGVPGVTVDDSAVVQGHKITVGGDFALGLGMGLALTYQDHPYALGMKARTWVGLGAQVYGLVSPATEPGPKTVTYFVQSQVGVPETPIVVGVEADYMPNKPPDDQVAIAPYLGVQYPFQNKPWGNVWGIEQTPRNAKTGEQGDVAKSVGYGWGGMVGVAAGASELGAGPASIGFVSPPANISMHMMH
jgi:hypothetical protein